ncbi:hypothetical protein JCM16303_005532 [Sporobolomyces ruberrimus]
MTSYSSMASSSSLGSTNSTTFFDQSGYSSADSSSTVPELVADGARQRTNGLQLPSLKASLIHLPLELPSPPEPLPEAGEGLVLDDDLQGAPLGFVVHRLRSLGPSLLKATTETCLFVPPGPTLPQYLRCTLPAFPSNDTAAAFRPSHVYIDFSTSPFHLLWSVL